MINKQVNVLIGTPVYRDGAYVLDKFLSNQEQIQRQSPSCELVFATCESDYLTELENLVKQYQLRATVIHFEVIKPDYAKSRFWNIAGGREAIRRYLLSRPEFDGLLFLDADMTFDPTVVDIMVKELNGYDVVFSGYKARVCGTALTGAGCLIMTRKILQKIKFRCYEYKNGKGISEDNVLEVDLFRIGARIKKGFFLAIDHYTRSNPLTHIEPRKVRFLTRIRTSPFFRYCVIKTDMLLRFNLSWKLFLIKSKLTGNR